MIKWTVLMSKVCSKVFFPEITVWSHGCLTADHQAHGAVWFQHSHAPLGIQDKVWWEHHSLIPLTYADLWGLGVLTYAYFWGLGEVIQYISTATGLVIIIFDRWHFLLFLCTGVKRSSVQARITYISNKGRPNFKMEGQTFIELCEKSANVGYALT